ncbi:phage tail tape measure protein [Sulfurimonas sp.]|uniref:phage tail tape measure protein n=1 Tax=Sulfurimonas sp. TaxID=2022749 RepID=UPI002B49D28C|nr:phage tail tape measure protein [Sulfurimonas sp.]
MALQEFGLGVLIGGLVASSFKSSVKYANTSISDIDKNVKKLSKTKLNIKTFKELSKDASKNRVKLAQFGRSLKNAGIDTKNLDKDTRLLRHSLVNLKKASKIQIKIDSNKAQFAQQKASIIGLGASIYGVTKIIGSANNVIKAQGEIKSLGITAQGIKSITRAGHEMSLQFGQIDGPAFIKASYDIKSGIASLSDEGVMKMTKMAATTAVATKASVADMTSLYALGYGIFREDFSSDMGFGKKFGNMIASAVQAFKTDGKDLADGMANVGAQAKAMGVSLEEELAIIGMSKKAFKTASEAGSGYKAFLGGVGKAQEKLGLTFVDSQGKMLPMVQVLKKIKNKYGDLDLAEKDELTTAFGGREATAIIDALINKTDKLSDAQIKLKKAMMSNKADEMAQAMNQGYGFEKMGNAMGYMAYTVGKVLSPAVDILATGLGGMAMGINWVDEKAGWLLPTVVGLGVGIVTLATILKMGSLAKLGFSLATNIVRKSVLLSTAENYANMMSFNRVSIATSFATAKTKALAAAQRAGAFSSKVLAFGLKAINLVLANNPIGWVIKGVMALGAGAIYLYKNFEPFTNLIDGIWENAKKFFGWIGDKLSVATDAFSGVSNFFGFGDEDKKSPLRAVAPIAISTALAANPMNIPEHKINTQSLNIPTQKEIRVIRENNTQTMFNNNSNITPIHKNYTISVMVQNPSSSIDIADVVKQAIKDIEDENRENSMEDIH